MSRNTFSFLCEPYILLFVCRCMHLTLFYFCSHSGYECHILHKIRNPITADYITEENRLNAVQFQWHQNGNINGGAINQRITSQAGIIPVTEKWDSVDCKKCKFRFLSLFLDSIMLRLQLWLRTGTIRSVMNSSLCPRWGQINFDPSANKLITFHRSIMRM